MDFENKILEKYIGKENWHLIDRVYLNYNDNLLLKFMFFNCKAIFRKYYFTIVLINNHKLVYRIKNHQKNQYKNEIVNINYFIKQSKVRILKKYILKKDLNKFNMVTANEILEKHIDKENWPLIEKVGLTFKDNFVLKTGTLHTE